MNCGEKAVNHESDPHHMVIMVSYTLANMRLIALQIYSMCSNAVNTNAVFKEIY